MLTELQKAAVVSGWRSDDTIVEAHRKSGELGKTPQKVADVHAVAIGLVISLGGNYNRAGDPNYPDAAELKAALEAGELNDEISAMMGYL